MDVNADLKVIYCLGDIHILHNNNTIQDNTIQSTLFRHIQIMYIGLLWNKVININMVLKTITSNIQGLTNNMYKLPRCLKIGKWKEIIVFFINFN